MGVRCESKERGEQDGEGEPCDEGVPLPGPEHVTVAQLWVGWRARKRRC